MIVIQGGVSDGWLLDLLAVEISLNDPRVEVVASSLGGLVEKPLDLPNQLLVSHRPVLVATTLDHGHQGDKRGSIARDSVHQLDS
jgi:hypothetical protein